MSAATLAADDLKGFRDELVWIDEFFWNDKGRMHIWRLEPEREDYLRAAARRIGITVRWNLQDDRMARAGGSTLTMWGARRRARRAFVREATKRARQAA